MLQAAGLRPTRQRMALGWLLFGKGARHLTAEMLYEEATLAKVPVSLATVYNTLNQLTDAGLLRQVSVDGTKTYFDTNVTAHHHFYLENNHELVDIPDPHLVLAEDARGSRRLRDRPGRHGGAVAQEALSSFQVDRSRRCPGLPSASLQSTSKDEPRCAEPRADDDLPLKYDDPNPPSHRHRRPRAVAARSSRQSRCPRRGTSSPRSA